MTSLVGPRRWLLGCVGLDAVRDNVAVEDDADAPWQATLDQTSGYANNLLDEASSLLFCV